MVAQKVKNLLAMWETWVQCLGWEGPLEEGNLRQYSEEFHGQRSLAGYSPWGRKKSDMTERLSLSLQFFTSNHSVQIS